MTCGLVSYFTDVTFLPMRQYFRDMLMMLWIAIAIDRKCVYIRIFLASGVVFSDLLDSRSLWGPLWLCVKLATLRTAWTVMYFADGTTF